MPIQNPSFWVNCTPCQTQAQNAKKASNMEPQIYYRVPTRPGKPGKMRVHLENLELSWNFEKFNKNHGK